MEWVWRSYSLYGSYLHKLLHLPSGGMPCVWTTNRLSCLDCHPSTLCGHILLDTEPGWADPLLHNSQPLHSLQSGCYTVWGDIPAFCVKWHKWNGKNPEHSTILGSLHHRSAGFLFRRCYVFLWGHWCGKYWLWVHDDIIVITAHN